MRVEVVGGGFGWVDRGSEERVIEGRRFVERVEKGEGFKIGWVEEIGWGKGWVDEEGVKGGGS